MNFEYAIIIKNKTRLEQLTERFNTKSQAQFYIERLGGNWTDYEAEHEQFHRSLQAVQQQVSSVIKNKIVERNFLASFIFHEKHLVVVVGQDGLVANTAKYVDGLPIIAINPDTERYDGILLPFHPENFMPTLKQVMKNDYASTLSTLAEAKLNDGQRLLAFNDLYLGASSHVSSRYKISWYGRSEEQSSSGIIISTRSGSSGWLSSVFNMTNGMNRFCGRSIAATESSLPEDGLMFVVREPFLSKKTQTGIVAGKLKSHEPLIVESYMPANGVIFSDGIESDFLNFNSGAIATIGTAQEKAHLVSPF